VLIYLGDLVAPFAALHHMLRPGGWLVFTIELGSSEGVTLQRSRRFAHTQHHVQAAAEASQLLFKHFETCVLRRERNQDVVGGLVALQRPV
jgi:predicted TPR repeat methyltransferase